MKSEADVNRLTTVDVNGQPALSTGCVLLNSDS